MDKQEIWKTISDAVVGVSPYAAGFLKEHSMHDGKEVYFVDLGINSIDYAEIAFIVMSKLKVSVSLDIFTRTNRISDAVDIFYNLTLQDVESEAAMTAS